MNDTDGSQTSQLWNIYNNHVSINAEALLLVQAQAKRLLAYAPSVGSWNACSYATLLLFYDNTTLDAVAKLWNIYAVELSQHETYRRTQDGLSSQ
jgi:hypothetical protein